MKRVDLAQVFLVFAVLADAHERPGHRLDGSQHRPPPRGRGWRVRAHVAGPVRASTVPAGGGGVLPPTSKNVYDRVIVFTSRDSLGSITKATGHCRFSPGSSVYCLKQKHSSLLKCAAAWCGA